MNSKLQEIGPWILLGLGVVLVLGGAVNWWWRGERRGRSHLMGLVVMLVFGGVFAGTSVFGLAFLKEFGTFLQSVRVLENMQASPGPSTYRDAFESIASGEFSAPLRRATLSLALEHPVVDMDTLMLWSAARASDDDGKVALLEARRTLHAKQRAASELVDALARTDRLTPSTVARFDAASRFLISSRVVRDQAHAEPRVLAIPAESVRAIARMHEQPPQFAP